ncbi:MAG: hypothetical protein ACK5Z0_07025 [Planctomycetota bacterium]
MPLEKLDNRSQCEPSRRDFLGKCLGTSVSCRMLIGLLLGSQAGCQMWPESDEKAKPGFRLGALRPPADGLAVLVAVVTLRDEQRELIEPLWRDWDSQAIGLIQRRAWDENGLRVAVAPTQLPGPLIRVLESEPESASGFLSQPRLTVDSALNPEGDQTAWRLTLREGQPKLIGVTPIYPEASWTVRSGSELTAGAGERVTGLIQISGIQAKEGTSRLTLRPLLRYGRAMTRVGVIDSSLAFQTSQSESLLDNLRVDVSLHSGQTLVAGLAPVSAELGDLLFGTPGIDGQERLLLVRLVHSLA